MSDSLQIEKILKEISEIEVHLDADPLEFGPNRITYKFHQIDQFSQRVSELEVNLSKDIHKLEKELNLEQLIYDQKKRILLSSDKEVMRGKTKGERDALADSLHLHSHVQKLDRIRQDISDLQMALEVVQMRKKDLRDTERRLRDQVKMVQESLKLGEAWNHNPVRNYEDDVSPMETLDEDLAMFLKPE